jgi:hypothetical protein
VITGTFFVINLTLAVIKANFSNEEAGALREMIEEEGAHHIHGAHQTPSHSLVDLVRGVLGR